MAAETTGANAEAEIKRAARRAAADRLRTRKAPRQSPSRRSHAFENAYYILGHGSDYSDKPTIQVPADYAVIAKAQPGESTGAIEKNNPLYDSNKQSYINPFKKSNLLYLIDKYKFMSIFSEGTMSPNFSFTLLGFFVRIKRNAFVFTESGIIEWPFRTKDKFIDREQAFGKIQIDSNDYLQDNMDTIIDLYKHSIYPTTEQVEESIVDMIRLKPATRIVDFINTINTKEHPSYKVFHITLSELFGKLPKGVIYNFVCRENEFSSKLYATGNTIDESMRGILAKKDQATLDARKGLQLIIMEALGTRAPMMRRLYTRSAASASASNSATSAPLDTTIKEKIMQIKAKIKELSYGTITKPALFAFIDLLIASVNIFNQDHHSVRALNETISRKLHLFLEQFEESDDIHTKYTELYTVFLKTSALKDYPAFLSRYVIDTAAYNEMKTATGPQLIQKYDSMPEYILKFVHNKKTNYTLLMVLLFMGKYAAFAHFYDKYPQLVRLEYYDYKLETITNISRCLLNKYIDTAPKTEVGYLTGFIEKEKEHLDHPALRSQLADSKYQNATILTIFEPYITHYKLHEEFPSIRAKMEEFELLPAA